MKEDKKIHVLLDLDQTLISAEPTEEYDFKQNKEKAKKFKFHDMDGYYVVFERPGVQEFLDFLFDNFTVSVWTAASKDYAVFVIDKIVLAKPERKLDYIFFAYHCAVSKHKKKGSKSLNMLWDVYKIPGYTKDNTLIIDDYDEVYKTQPDNCVAIPAFEFTNSDSPNDKLLTNMIPELKKLSQGKQTVKETVKNVNDSNKK